MYAKNYIIIKIVFVNLLILSSCSIVLPGEPLMNIFEHTGKYTTRLFAVSHDEPESNLCSLGVAKVFIPRGGDTISSHLDFLESSSDQEEGVAIYTFDGCGIDLCHSAAVRVCSPDLITLVCVGMAHKVVITTIHTDEKVKTVKEKCCATLSKFHPHETHALRAYILSAESGKIVEACRNHLLAHQSVYTRLGEQEVKAHHLTEDRIKVMPFPFLKRMYVVHKVT